MVPTGDADLGLAQQFLGFGGFASQQHLEAVFAVHGLFQRAFGGAAVELQGVFALFGPAGVVAVE